MFSADNVSARKRTYNEETDRPIINDNTFEKCGNYNEPRPMPYFQERPRRFSTYDQRDELLREPNQQFEHNLLPRLPKRDVNTEGNPQVNFRARPCHRRNLSEDLSVFKSNELPPLPNSRIQNCGGAREHLLKPGVQINRTLRRQTDEEIEAEGRELFYNFAAEQFMEEDLNPNEYNMSVNFSNPTWRKAGRDLRLLADEFCKSKERRRLRKKAQEVDMSSLTCENFFHLCNELFNRGEGGLTQERIVVLFTFIVDIAIYQVRKKAEKFLSSLMEWSLKYIFEYICACVKEAGGWNAVLSQGANFVYKLAIFSFLTLGIAAFGIFIIKNYRNL